MAQDEKTERLRRAAMLCESWLRWLCDEHKIDPANTNVSLVGAMLCGKPTRATFNLADAMKEIEAANSEWLSQPIPVDTRNALNFSPGKDSQ